MTQRVKKTVDLLRKQRIYEIRTLVTSQLYVSVFYLSMVFIPSERRDLDEMQQSWKDLKIGLDKSSIESGAMLHLFQ